MIKIAITKGRIEKQVCQLLSKQGFDMEPIFHKDRELMIETPDGLSMIFAKANDVLIVVNVLLLNIPKWLRTISIKNRKMLKS